MGERRMRRALSLALIVALAGPALPQAQDDEGVLTRVLQTLLSDAGREVRIRGFEGALSSRATVRQISIADAEGVWITLDGLVLDWNRAALLERRIEVNTLSAERITVHRAPLTEGSDTGLTSPTASTRFALPELPVSVRIGEVRAESVTLDPAVIGQSAAFSLIGGATLQGGQGETRFDARRIDGTPGEFRIHGAFSNTSRALMLDMALDEGADGIVAGLLGIPGRPALGLSIRGEGPLSTFTAEIALQTEGQRRIDGRFSLIDESPDDAFLDGGGFALDVEGDLRPLLVPDLHPFFGPSSRLTATGSRDDRGEIDLPVLSVRTGALSLEGSAALRPDGLPRRVGLVARLDPGPAGSVLLPATGGAARLGGATMDVLYDEQTSRDWTARVLLERLDLPSIDLAAMVLDARGRVNPAQPGDGASLPLFEGVFDFAAEGLSASDPDVHEALGGAFYGLASVSLPEAGEAITLTGLAFEGETLSMTAHGRVRDLAFDGFAEFEVPDLAAFSGLAGRPLGGDALVTLIGRADPLTGALDLDIDLSTRDLTLGIPEADALLAGDSGISLSILRDTEGTTLRGLSVIAGTAEINAQGIARPDLTELRARIAVSDLAELGRGWGGRLAVEADVTLRPEQSRLQLDGTLIDLNLSDLPGAGILAGVLRGATRLRVDLRHQGEVTAISAFTLRGPALSASATGQWSPAAPDIAVTIEQLDLAALAPAGRGTLTGAVSLRGSEAGRLLGGRLAGVGPLVTGIAPIDGLLAEGLILNAELLQDPAGALALRQADLVAGGLVLGATGRQSAEGEGRLVLTGRLDSLARMVPGLAGPLQADATLTRAAGQIWPRLAATLSGPGGLAAQAQGLLGETLNLTLQGQVESALVNPTIEPNSVQGLIRFDGTIIGPPVPASLSLRASAEGGQLALPVQYLAFRDIVASARLRGLTAEVSVEGTSQGGGRATLGGTIHLDQGREADLGLRLQDLTVQAPNLFDARLSGDLRLTGRLAEGARAAGRLQVGSAEIRIPHSPLARQGLRLSGLRHIGEGAESARTRTAAGIVSGTRTRRAPVPLALDVTLEAPSRVFVRGRGLDAELGGTLRLGGTTRAIVPSGAFQLIRGRLDLLGNRFVLTDGSASMIGSFLPLVSLTATTESGGVSTSVTVAGPADSPEITFSSIPELPQDEVLARLLFRRSLAALSPFQAAQLALSVATLTGRADDSVLSRTRQAMGLDDLDFRVDEDGNTELRAGRTLAEGVYTDVGVNSDGRGEVSINLDLSPSLTLRGRADTRGGSGIGLFFERDY